MNEIKKYICWLFWSLIYLPLSKPKELKRYLRRSLRTFPPWWKFKPFVSFDDEHNVFSVYFSNESTVTESITLTDVQCFVTNDRRIVGMRLHEDDLRPFNAGKENE